MNLGKMVPSGSGTAVILESCSVKRVSAAKRWCFTLNNYTEEDFGSIKKIVEQYCKKACIGREKASTGTPHLQGYIEFLKKDRPKNKKYCWNQKIHWEKCKGDEDANISYCEKDGDVWYFPTPYEIDIENWYEWELDLLKILKEKPDDRTIYWIWEGKGCAGKTVFQKWIYTNLQKRTITLSGKCNDMKNGIIAYKQTNGALPEIILINIPRVNKNHVSIAGVEEIKDMYFFCGKYEGGMVCGPNPHVCIFANEKPPEDVLSKDRLKVIYIGKHVCDDYCYEEICPLMY